MAIDPPYRFDPFQNLVNVSWEAGTGGFEPNFYIGVQIYIQSGGGAQWVAVLPIPTGSASDLGLPYPFQTDSSTQWLSIAGSSYDYSVAGTWSGWPSDPGISANAALHFGAAAPGLTWGEASLEAFVLSSTVYRSHPDTGNFYGPSIGVASVDWQNIVFTPLETDPYAGSVFTANSADSLRLPYSGESFTNVRAVIRMKR